MKYYNKIIYYFIIFVICILYIFNMLLTLKLFSLEIFSYVLYGIGLCALALYIYPLFKKGFKLKKTDIFIFLLIIFAIISTIFSYHIKSSLFGLSGWYEGLFSLLSYYFTFLVSSRLENDFKNKVINVFLLGSFFVLIFAFFQILNFDFVFIPEAYICSIFGNANYYAAYSVLALGLSVGLFCNRKSKLYFAFVLINLFGVFLANSTTGLIGTVFVLFVLLFTKKFKEFFIIYLTAIILFLFTGLFVTENIFLEVTKIFNESNLVLDDSSNITKVGTNRGYLYTETIKYVPDHFINGIGVDNFRYIDDGGPIVFNEVHMYASKAHSDLLQIFITQGIFALLTYIVMYVYLFIKYFKCQKNDYNFAIFIGISAYLFQAQFNNTVINLAPFFFIILSLLIDNENTVCYNKQNSIGEYLWKKKKRKITKENF